MSPLLTPPLTPKTFPSLTAAMHAPSEPPEHAHAHAGAHRPQRGQLHYRARAYSKPHVSSPLASPDGLVLPPLALDAVPALDLDDSEAADERVAGRSFEQQQTRQTTTPFARFAPSCAPGGGCAPPETSGDEKTCSAGDDDEHVWRAGMLPAERDAREAWISGGRGRKGLRIVIVTGEWLCGDGR